MTAQKVWFMSAVEALEATFFRPASGKMGIPIEPSGKIKISKSSGCVFQIQPETEMYTTVLTKHSKNIEIWWKL
jgi:hypothetical protein